MKAKPTTDRVLYIDIFVGRIPDDWAEGVALKRDALGWYICHPINIALLGPWPKTMDDDRYAIRVEADAVLLSLADGSWRVRSQEPETDAGLRARLKHAPRAMGAPGPYNAWDAEVDAAEGAALDQLAAETYGVVRVCVPQHYMPWGRSDKDRALPLPAAPARFRA